MVIKLTQGMKNMCYKHTGPEAKKHYLQLLKSYNQKTVMFTNIIYSHAKHDSCKDLQHSNFLFWGKGNEDKAELSPKSSSNISPGVYNQKS